MWCYNDNNNKINFLYNTKIVNDNNENIYDTHTHTARHENDADADVDDDVNDNSFVSQFFIHLFMANILEFSFI